jgi:NADH dehydrogenase
MILVAGATGVLGSEIVRRLLAQGEPVRALVRATSDPAKVARLESDGVDIARGDLKDPSSLDAACHGVGAVISTVSIILTAQAGDSFAGTDEAGTRHLIDAARRAGVAHFTYLSFDHERAPESPLARAKREVEAHLCGSGLSYTILRPGLFMESWLGPMLFADPASATAKVYGDGETKLNYVAVADVAGVAVRSLSSAAAKNAVLPFGGPEALTQREAVRLFEEVFGKPFEVSEIPESALEAQWTGAEDPFQKTFAGLMLGVARGMGSETRHPPTPLLPRMTSVREYVRRAATPG